ncbi:unnamed protein product [Cercopithifilaria johnstoni]|uniref:Tyrosine-protein phosphatase domain-containing protein n=1 Tax=Cercopithifilaria johnstoni TaxID=2874296 RepID=A0A8J2Q9E3_9BILA|nr:unnamed protein product [Cercopithifilaria johnstoni]
MDAELDDESITDDDDYEEDESRDLATPQEVVEQIVKSGEKIIVKWHNIILKEPPKFDAFLEQANILKNRYPNVILYDRTRVKLLGDKLGDDYYHASYVDSYDRSDGYLLAQAPFDETTESDFWRMIFQTGVKLIVLLTDVNNLEGNRIIKHFWPESATNARNYPEANIKVNYMESVITALYDWYKFSISDITGMNKIAVLMLHYRKWIYDKIIPDNLLEFRSEVDNCVHRSGTYAVLDIVLDRVTAEKKVGLLETASIVRKQRYGCMSYYSHYSHVADLVVRYAIAMGIVDIECINGKK